LSGKSGNFNAASFVNTLRQKELVMSATIKKVADLETFDVFHFPHTNVKMTYLGKDKVLSGMGFVNYIQVYFPRSEEKVEVVGKMTFEAR
jgi:hypothetical protein